MCGGGGSGLLSHCDSFYKLCSSLWPPKLPEQTETGAIRGSCSQRHIQYTTSIGFAFFDSIVGWYILECMRMVASTRDVPWAASVGGCFPEITEGYRFPFH